jgi:hypothetical protein
MAYGIAGRYKTEINAGTNQMKKRGFNNLYGANITLRSFIGIVLSIGKRHKTKKNKIAFPKFINCNGVPPYQLKARYDLETYGKVKTVMDLIPSVEEILRNAALKEIGIK